MVFLNLLLAQGLAEIRYFCIRTKKLPVKIHLHRRISKFSHAKYVHAYRFLKAAACKNHFYRPLLKKNLQFSISAKKNPASLQLGRKTDRIRSETSSIIFIFVIFFLNRNRNRKPGYENGIEYYRTQIPSEYEAKRIR